MTESSKNQLYYGDNLDILRRYVEDETVDLVYLDPPDARTTPALTLSISHAGPGLSGYCEIGYKSSSIRILSNQSVFWGWLLRISLSDAEADAQNIAVPDDIIFSFQPEVAVLAHPFFRSVFD